LPIAWTVKNSTCDIGGETFDKPSISPVLFSRPFVTGISFSWRLGPHPELIDNIQRCFAAKNAEGHVVGTLRHAYDDRRALLETAGGLYTRGCAIEWARIMATGGRCVPLPTYTWQRERFWVDLPDQSRLQSGTGHNQTAETTAPPPKVVFVFPGQGSQWLGMGRELLARETAFRTALEACNEAILKEAGFSVLAELQADELTSRLNEIDVVQPVLFAIEVALAELWRSRGIEPDCVVGHSMGEVAAAHIAGMLTLGRRCKSDLFAQSSAKAH
jgi:acyl transferase domain-containing protein